MTLERTDIKPTKGTMACNRTACQRDLVAGERWYNISTRAYYCRACACKINRAADYTICFLEGTHADEPR